MFFSFWHPNQAIKLIFLEGKLFWSTDFGYCCFRTNCSNTRSWMMKIELLLMEHWLNFGFLTFLGQDVGIFLRLRCNSSLLHYLGKRNCARRYVFFMTKLKCYISRYKTVPHAEVNFLLKTRGLWITVDVSVSNLCLQTFSKADFVHFKVRVLLLASGRWCVAEKRSSLAGQKSWIKGDDKQKKLLLQ